MSPAIQQFIKVLFQVAWADEVVSPSEVQALMTTLRQLGIPLPEVISLMDRNLGRKPELPPTAIDEIFEDREVQLEALQLVMNICMADGCLQPEELGYLEGLVIRMGVTSTELEQIRKRAGG